MGGAEEQTSPALLEMPVWNCYHGQNRCAVRVLPVGGAAEASCARREGRWECSAPQGVISGWGGPGSLRKDGHERRGGQ